MNINTLAVGDGATVGIGSDQYPYTIIAINKNGKEVVIQRDDYSPAPGYEYYGSQVYEYTRNTNNKLEVWTLRNNGHYAKKGSPKGSCYYLSFNGRNAYRDPSF